jgi:hypothetical protein
MRRHLRARRKSTGGTQMLPVKKFTAAHKSSLAKKAPSSGGIKKARARAPRERHE